MSRATATSTFRPSRAQRGADRVRGWLLRHGRGPKFMWLLTVRGRVTGQVRTTPVVPVRHGGDVCVVSPYGQVNWVRNLRAAGHLEMHRGDEHTTYDARELDAAEAVPVLRAYLSMPSARFVSREFDVTSAESDEAIAAEAHRHPTFALTPAP